MVVVSNDTNYFNIFALLRCFLIKLLGGDFWKPPPKSYDKDNPYEEKTFRLNGTKRHSFSSGNL